MSQLPAPPVPPTPPAPPHGRLVREGDSIALVILALVGFALALPLLLSLQGCVTIEKGAVVTETNVMDPENQPVLAAGAVRGIDTQGAPLVEKDGIKLVDTGGEPLIAEGALDIIDTGGAPLIDTGGAPLIETDGLGEGWARGAVAIGANGERAAKYTTDSLKELGTYLGDKGLDMLDRHLTAGREEFMAELKAGREDLNEKGEEIIAQVDWANEQSATNIGGIKNAMWVIAICAGVMCLMIGGGVLYLKIDRARDTPTLTHEEFAKAMAENEYQHGQIHRKPNGNGKGGGKS